MANKFLKVLSFFTFPAVVFFIRILLGNLFDIYHILPSVDMFFHFLGGFAVGFMFLLFLNFFEKQNLLFIRNKNLFLVLIVSLVCFISVLWEFWEFFLDFFFELNWQVSVEDTLLDLLIGILGGFAVGLLGRTKFCEVYLRDK